MEQLFGKGESMAKVMVAKNEKIPKGIGGWLLLPTVGFFVAFVLCLLFAVAMTFSLIFEEGGFWEGFYLIIVIVYLPIIAFTLYLEFKKKKEFPKWVITLSCVGVFVSFLFSIEDGDYSGVPKDFLTSLLWIVYFHQSKRVKNTFVK